MTARLRMLALAGLLAAGAAATPATAATTIPTRGDVIDVARTGSTVLWVETAGDTELLLRSARDGGTPKTLDRFTYPATRSPEERELATDLVASPTHVAWVAQVLDDVSAEGIHTSKWELRSGPIGGPLKLHPASRTGKWPVEAHALSGTTLVRSSAHRSNEPPDEAAPLVLEDLATGTTKTLAPAASAALAGRFLATAGPESIELTDLDTGTPTFSVPRPGIEKVRVTANGDLAWAESAGDGSRVSFIGRGESTPRDLGTASFPSPLDIAGGKILINDGTDDALVDVATGSRTRTGIARPARSGLAAWDGAQLVQSLDVCDRAVLVVRRPAEPLPSTARPRHCPAIPARIDVSSSSRGFTVVLECRSATSVKRCAGTVTLRTKERLRVPGTKRAARLLVGKGTYRGTGKVAKDGTLTKNVKLTLPSATLKAMLRSGSQQVIVRTTRTGAAAATFERTFCTLGPGVSSVCAI